jgi:hypothetical protein
VTAVAPSLPAQRARGTGGVFVVAGAGGGVVGVVRPHVWWWWLPRGAAPLRALVCGGGVSGGDCWLGLCWVRRVASRRARDVACESVVGWGGVGWGGWGVCAGLRCVFSDVDRRGGLVLRRVQSEDAARFAAQISHPDHATTAIGIGTLSTTRDISCR